jgi:general secretion pathway protein L
MLNEVGIIYIHRDIAKISGARTNSQGQIVETLYYRDMATIASMIGSIGCWVIVPAIDIVLLSVSLPMMNKTNLLKALPFAVEEQLAGDVADLHFALANERVAEQWVVAAVAREKMQMWLMICKEQGVNILGFIPASLAFSYSDNETHIYHIDDEVLVRTGRLTGFACDHTNFDTYISLLPQPKCLIKTFNEPSFLDVVANQLKQEPIPINLLQGAFAQKRKASDSGRKFWQINAVLAAVFVLFLFLNPIVSYLMLNAHTSQIEQEINAIYKMNFPQASAIIAPKLRMQEKLQNVKANGGESHLIQQLALVAEGIRATSDVQLKRYDYQGKQLNLEVSASSSDAISSLSDYLTQQGLRVQQQNANFVGNQINATLQIS